MCVGVHRVPVVPLLAPDETGNLKRYGMVHLGQSHRIAPWLVTSLLQDGSKWEQHFRKVPLFEQLLQKVASQRHKRIAGTWCDADGRVLPKVLPVTVRGQKLLVANDLRTLTVNLGDDVGLMDWFLRQLWQDLETIQTPSPSPARGPDPNDVVPGLEDHANKLMKQMKEHQKVRSASWFSRMGRFRVCLKNKSLKYKQVPRWKKLVATDSADEVLRSLTQCQNDLFGELDDDEGGPDGQPKEAEAAPEPMEAEAAAAGA